MVTRAAIYVRVSTEEQARDGYGLAAQEQSARAYCQAQGWELVDVYRDAGRSGKSVRGREALRELLDRAKAGQFERVVFWKLDRLGRNLRDLLEICEQLEGADVAIVSVQEAIDTGTPSGRMIRNVLGSLAEFERDIIVDRIKAGLAEKARQGELLGPLPIGYQRDDSGSVIPDATAPLICDAFVRYASGRYSLRDMAAWAAGVGLLSREGNPLDRLSIRKILTNATYAGHVHYHSRRGGGVVATGSHSPLVDADLFATVQATLARRRRRVAPARPFGREPYPLSGTAICGSCGAPLLGCASTVLGKYRYRHMRCSTAQRRGREACEQPMVRAETLETQIGSYLTGMQLPQACIDEVVEELRSRTRAGTGVLETRRLKRELDRWQRLFVLGEISEDRYLREAERLKELLQQAEKDPRQLDLECAADYLRNVGDLWQQSPRQLQRDFVREIFQTIVVERDEVSAITPRLPYVPLFVVDRRERFGQTGPDFCSMAPRAGFEPTT